MASKSWKVFLLFGLISGFCRPLAADEIASIQFVESYAGPHAHEFNDLLDQVKSIVPAAMAYITNQWGLPNTLHYPMIVSVIDAHSTIPGRPISAYVRASISAGELRQELVVDIEHHMMYPGENLENVLYHEMAHAVLQDAITSPQATGIPQWFNEGLAQSVTTEGHDRTAEDFKRLGHTDSPAILCDLNGNIDAFYHGEYNFGCYTQFYLAVQRLQALGGKDTIAKVIAGLHNGFPLQVLIRQVTPLDWTGFQRDIQQYTRNVFAGTESIP